MVDADRVRAGQGLFQLAVIGGQGLMEKPPVVGDHVLPQQRGVGHVKAGLGPGQPPVPVIENPAGAQVVPHAGGVAVPGLAPLHHVRHILYKFVQVSVEQVNVHAAGQRAVVLVLPEAVAQLHPAAEGGQQVPPDLLRDLPPAVEVHVVVGCLVVVRPRPGAPQGDGLHLRQGRQALKKRLYWRMLSVHSCLRSFLYRQHTTLTVQKSGHLSPAPVKVYIFSFIFPISIRQTGGCHSRNPFSDWRCQKPLRQTARQNI